MMILKHAFQAAVTVSVRTVDFPLKPSRIVNITLGTDWLHWPHVWNRCWTAKSDLHMIMNGPCRG